MAGMDWTVNDRKGWAGIARKVPDGSGVARIGRHGAEWFGLLRSGVDWQARRGLDSRGKDVIAEAGVAATGIAGTGPDWHGRAAEARIGKVGPIVVWLGRHGGDGTGPEGLGVAGDSMKFLCRHPAPRNSRGITGGMVKPVEPSSGLFFGRRGASGKYPVGRGVARQAWIGSDRIGQEGHGRLGPERHGWGRRNDEKLSTSCTR